MLFWINLILVYLRKKPLKALRRLTSLARRHPISVESAKKYKSHKKRVYFNLIKSNNANNGLLLFVHFLQDLYRRSCRPGAALRACPGSARPFFVLCFLLVKFINLLDMYGLSIVTLTALSTVMPQRRRNSL
ncbi:MAG: hypothetical protein K0R73_796 [Candidatus Midichloriaceae bacterium]|jgi:hypothetical protein|nr:hypothetical protein [Candidatus Midichloriaceae bacterium]